MSSGPANQSAAMPNELEYDSNQPVMLNFSTLPPPPPQPPPLPPPPLSIQLPPTLPYLNQRCGFENPTSAKSTSYGSFFSTSDQEASRAYQFFLKDRRIAEEDYDTFTFFSNYHPVRPVIQNGPLCGVVALSMATELVKRSAVSTDDIFAEAKKAGYSIQGEMFSADSMQKLAAKFLHGPVQLVSLKCQNEMPHQLDGKDLIDALVDGHCLLVPYDADKNHSPCLANGHKAHWALITGFFAAFKKLSSTEIQQYHVKLDEEKPSLYYWNSSSTDETARGAMKCLLKSCPDLFIFAHQGKSKLCGIWNFCDLLSSNNNLFEAGPERTSIDYVIPPGGVEEGLRAKVILIHNQTS